jgi:hypothetical protein
VSSHVASRGLKDFSRPSKLFPLCISLLFLLCVSLKGFFRLKWRRLDEWNNKQFDFKFRLRLLSFLSGKLCLVTSFWNFRDKSECEDWNPSHNSTFLQSAKTRHKAAWTKSSTIFPVGLEVSIVVLKEQPVGANLLYLNRSICMHMHQ